MTRRSPASAKSLVVDPVVEPPDKVTTGCTWHCRWVLGRMVGNQHKAFRRFCCWPAAGQWHVTLIPGWCSSIHEKSLSSFQHPNENESTDKMCLTVPC